MNHSVMTAVTALLLMCCIATASAQQRPRTGPTDRPNVVIIYTDDMGYGDLSCYGATDIQTERLDQMAAEGVRFTAFYNSSSACTTSRAALLTGSYHARVSVLSVFPPNGKYGLNPDEITIAEVLKQRDYATACIGKWHLGDHPTMMPNAQGFDYFFGIPVSHDYRAYANGVPLWENDTLITEGLPAGQYTRTLTDKAIAFIRRSADAPFFLYLAQPQPHVPLGVTEAFRGRSQRGLYGDVMVELDDAVGRIIDTLTELGIERNTLVIFMTDNGPWSAYGDHAGSTGGLRGAKRDTFEGGVRTPCIVWWPGQARAGEVCDIPAATIDWLPTIAALTRTTPPTDRVIDGTNIASLMFNGVHPRVDPERPIVFYHWAGRNLQSLRMGRWKLHLPHTYTYASEIANGGRRGSYANQPIELSLFDLEADPGESRNVAADHPRVVDRMMTIANRYRRDLGDNLTKTPPGPNVRPAGVRPGRN